MRLLAGCAVLLVGCLPHAVRFDGQAREPVAAEAVVEESTLPRSAERLGRLSVRCTPRDDWSSFDDVALVDLDCTETRARRMLRDAAAENGGNVLAEVSCRVRGSVTCRALVGRAPVTAPPPPVGAPDVRGSAGADVFVEFQPELPRAPGPPRVEAAVRDLPALPPSHLRVGSVVTRCEACVELAARDAMRIAVGRLGATDAVGVRCEAWAGGHRCAGSAAVAEREPDPPAN